MIQTRENKQKSLTRHTVAGSIFCACFMADTMMYIVRKSIAPKKEATP